ncbi:hypothetical protein ONE63_005667 [Megalurothrips usitatus]|uniref:Glutamate receptor ionotropic, kainate 2-like n=1 Tax=Megalurothrips usitatus TaxID=439358 RepID=A0AAV7XZS5_9NEOP|nr:hypothetical protein ONE63_005667 [Megalurothrips usitatus]
MDAESVTAFHRAIELVNMDRSLLPNRRLVGVNLTVPELDALQAHRTVCDLLAGDLGVAAVVGPTGRIPATYVQSVLDAMEVPHLSTRPGERTPSRRGMLQVNLHPSADTLSKMYAEMVPALGWAGFTVVYAETTVQLQQCGMLVPPFSFFFTNLELTTLDLTPFQFGGANITGLRLVKGPLPARRRLSSADLPGPQLQPALFHDAVHVLGHALHNLQDDWLTTRALDCEAPGDSWEHGASLINYIRTTEVHGLSGLVKFDSAGRRSQVAVELVELSERGLEKVAVWNTTDGINMTRAPHKAHAAPDWLPSTNSAVFNRTLVVLIAMTPPYAMLKENSESLQGDKRFEGFGIELIDELARMLGFNYTFVVQEDGQYGTCNATACSGMMAAVDSKKVDLAIVDLTITSERESRVDFTTPFLSLGIQILYRTPKPLPPSLMSFMSPFSNDVWLAITAVYIGVSLLMFVMARISPYEWNNPYPCIEDPTELENQFSLRNAFWFTIGSIMQQGSEIAPIATSLRLAASSWWLFTLIMVSSYTANLAAFLTVRGSFDRIKSADDLAAQTEIKYGAKSDGSTMTFFERTNNTVYHKMYLQMKEWDSQGLGVSMKNNEAGLERVASGEDFAFLMESVAIEYMTERNCNVTSVGSRLDEKGYGIAMAKNAPFRTILSAGVLRLQETGQMMEMKDKWWKNKRGGGACLSESSSDVSELGMDNVGGVFLVLVTGCALAILIALGELAIHVHRTASKEDLSFREEMLEELRFIFQGDGDVKPVRHLRIRDDSAETEKKQDLGSPEDSPEIID